MRCGGASTADPDPKGDAIEGWASLGTTANQHLAQLRTHSLGRLVWYAGCVGVTAALYYGAARAGLRLAYLHGAVTAFWPPVGVGIAALVLGGVRLWPGVVIGDLLAGDFSTPLGTVLGQTTGNTLEVVIGALVFVRLTARRADFERVRDVLALVVAAAFGTFVSAVVGVTSLRLGDVIARHEVVTVWRTWWLSDFSGALVVTPLLLVWAKRRLAPFGVRDLVEGLALTTILVLLVELPSQGDVPYIVFPALIWAALRFGTRGAATATALVSTLSVWNTAHNSGPFVRTTITHSLLSTQLFIAAAALTSLVLAAAAAERTAASASVQARLGELARERNFIATVVNVSPSFFCLVKPDGAIVRFNQSLSEATGIPDDERTRGRLFWDVFALPEESGGVREALSRGSSGEHEHRWVGRERPRVVDWSCVPIEDEEGEPRLLVCGLDVTHRHEQQQELKRSRSRIVEVGDAERRRLERNLHDGAQQRLVSVSLGLRLARGKLRDAPDASDEVLSNAEAELAMALQELRELARGLHPALLSDRGLKAALSSLAQRSALPVELHVDCDERLPEPVEVAAFYVASEAIANVAKYAQATTVDVHVQQTHASLRLEVADDGIGGAEAGEGSGLRGLADRVHALDGHFEVDSPPRGGTRIRAELPLQPR